MSNRGIFTISASVVVLGFGAGAIAQVSIDVINPGGEAYPNNGDETAAISTEIPPGGVAPLSETGWQGTVPRVAGQYGVDANDRHETIGDDTVNQAHSGFIRLAFGSIEDQGDVLAEDAILFQETDHTVAAGEIFTMDWFGRGFFQYDEGEDAQASFFGYVDSGGNLVEVDTALSPQVVTGVWTAAQHEFAVPSDSPLIGENLVIGFYTETGGVGGFSSIDDVSLTVIPEPTALAVVGLGGLTLLRRRRA